MAHSIEVAMCGAIFPNNRLLVKGKSKRVVICQWPELNASGLQTGSGGVKRRSRWRSECVGQGLSIH